MSRREDLSYKETKTPYIFTGASDIDEALDKALEAIRDARSFRDYARATGTDVVKRDVSLTAASMFFAAGVAFCAFVLWCLGVI